MRWIAGVDPGLFGAVALLDAVANRVSVHDMPQADGRVDAAALAGLLMDFQPSLVVIENVHSMPKQGVASSFKFGRAYGTAEGVIGTLSLPFIRLTPQEWKGELGLIRKDKEASRLLARELWPEARNEFRLKKHQDRAEAALLCEAYRRRDRGKYGE